MIDTKELRISNWVTENGRLVHLHDGFGIDHAYNFEPIPLTEEWLLKFGFEKTKENFLTYDLGKISIYMPTIHYKEGRTYFNSWVIIEHSPKYVHQLQNLYFALTGEELECNSNSEIKEIDEETEEIKRSMLNCTSYINNPRNGISQYTAMTERMLLQEKLSKLERKKKESEKSK